MNTIVRLLGLLPFCSASLLPAQNLLVKDGDTVAFMGDSITAGGAGSPAGYVRLVESGLKANGIGITVLPAGVSGEKSDQMLARLEKTVLDKKPALMTLSCGVNDVWHQEKGKGVLLEDYKKNITEIADRAAKANVQLVLFTATLIGTDLQSVSNIKAADYNAFLRDLAKERNLPLADLNADMRKEWEALQASDSKKQLTTDGVHMNYRGNLLMARGVLRSFGLNEAQLKTAEEHWRSIPGLISLDVKSGLNLAETERFEELAAKAGKSPGALAKELLEAAVRKEIESSPDN